MGFDSVLSSVKANKIEDIDLTCEDFSPEQLAELVDALCQNISVRKLKLDSTALKDGDLSTIAPKISITRLENISWSNSSFTDVGIRHLMRHLPSTCRHLSLSGSKIGDQGVLTLLAVIKEKSLKISTLWLNGIGMSDIGIRGIADFLTSEDSVSLQELNISGNSFSTEAIHRFADKLEGAKNLDTLFASSICAKNAEITTLLNVLLRLKIKKLYLSDNHLGSSRENFNLLLGLIRSSPDLTDLSICYNEIQKEWMTEFVTAVLTNKSIFFCSVSWNFISAEDSLRLEETLSQRAKNKSPTISHEMTLVPVSSSDERQRKMPNIMGTIDYLLQMGRVIANNVKNKQLKKADHRLSLQNERLKALIITAEGIDQDDLRTIISRLSLSKNEQEQLIGNIGSLLSERTLNKQWSVNMMLALLTMLGMAAETLLLVELGAPFLAQAGTMVVTVTVAAAVRSLSSWFSAFLGTNVQDVETVKILLSIQTGLKNNVELINSALRKFTTRFDVSSEQIQQELFLDSHFSVLGADRRHLFLCKSRRLVVEESPTPILGDYGGDKTTRSVKSLTLEKKPQDKVKTAAASTEVGFFGAVGKVSLSSISLGNCHCSR